ncbi:MAG TPA: bifunctional NADH-specific enoyl-ACP reductase/trans-2-enoyl-CoA reductase [Verrucomicrobiales bacterium]|nr:bifunctional NADH-specific enoyl-ACP reductase/trans-2-enoyl-CoA reductase [Verrucomicrobiales bacterium]
MVIKPKVRGFICVTAHPQGCAAHVQEWIDYIRKQGPIAGAPPRVLVVGSSTGYGLASRITAAFGAGARTIGVAFERPSEPDRLGTTGWYNTLAFERAAKAAGLYARSFNGDAFSDAMKQEVIAAAAADLGKVDLLVYSLASPRRTHPRSGVTFKSTLKPIGQPFASKTVDVEKGTVGPVAIDPANEQEIADTVAVMGGEDWQMWVDALRTAGLLSERFTTVAYSYVGPELTMAIYRNGTIGAAKEHLEKTAHELNAQLAPSGGRAFVSINKALVTQASSAIPVVPLYISLLYKVMKAQGLHEGCIEQIHRLFKRLYAETPTPVDKQGRIRIDDWEMRPDVQEAVAKLWSQVTTENLASISDIEGYRSEFLKLFGFGLPGVDYDAECDPNPTA